MYETSSADDLDMHDDGTNFIGNANPGSPITRILTIMTFDIAGAYLGVPTVCALLVIFCLCLVGALCLIAWLWLKYKRREENRKKYNYEVGRNDPEAALKLYPGNIHDLIEESSGSGSGLPYLVSGL